MQVVDESLEKELLTLPVVQRAALAEKLLSSLDSPAQKEWDADWANEAEDRIRAYEQGKLKVSEDAEVYKRLDKKLGR